MTERLKFDAPLSRRRALGLGAAVVASTVLPANASEAGPRPAHQTGRRFQGAAVDALRPTIRPRADWAGDLGVKGPLVPEDDVRFLLVHHTASTNDYGPDEVASQIRGWYEFHTGAEKGWPDIAYNFLIDRFGGIWEGRQGSLEGPVQGDATGGSQGFALLCSLIGNYAEAEMTAEQQVSLAQLLAWLAETHSIDTSAEATVSFASRGSNLWPAGTEVTASTISGHRDMSTTSCPGDFVYPMLADVIPAEVTRLRLEATGGTGAETESPTEDTAAPSSVAPEADPDASTPGPTPTTAPVTAGEDVAAEAAPDAAPDPLVIGGAVAGAVAAGVGLVSLVRASHRARADEEA